MGSDYEVKPTIIKVFYEFQNKSDLSVFAILADYLLKVRTI